MGGAVRLRVTPCRSGFGPRSRDRAAPYRGGRCAARVRAGCHLPPKPPILVRSRSPSDPPGAEHPIRQAGRGRSRDGLPILAGSGRMEPSSSLSRAPAALASRMSTHVIVIGGGISGLATAAALARSGVRVTLLEGDGDLGGLGTTFPFRGGTLERFYHCILPTDRALVRWIHALGLGADLMWKRIRMGFTYRLKTYKMDGPLDLLRFSPLTFGERLRLGLMGLRARGSAADLSLDDVPVGDWARAQVGDRVFEVLWKPLLEAKIGDGYPGIPATWLANRLSREKNAGPEVKGG